jgi:hypothetical protein
MLRRPKRSKIEVVAPKEKEEGVDLWKSVQITSQLKWRTACSVQYLECCIGSIEMHVLILYMRIHLHMWQYPIHYNSTLFKNVIHWRVILWVITQQVVVRKITTACRVITQKSAVLIYFVAEARNDVIW